MKKQLLYKLLLIVIILAFSACNDPIFYRISIEVEPLDPRIKGSPTNFISFNNKMYVASGSILFWYDEDKNSSSSGTWEEATITDLNGNVLQLTATTGYIYALCEESGNRVLKNSYNGRLFNDVSGLSDRIVQSIYSQGDQLFFAAGDIGSFSIYYFDLKDNNSVKQLIATDNKIINGIAYDGTNYYLSAKDLATINGGCIYVINLNNDDKVSVIGNDIPFMGMITLDDATILAIDRNGRLYRVSDLGTVVSFNSRLATGALAIWRDNDEAPRLLLAGRQDEMEDATNYDYGYLELELNSSGGISGSQFYEPGSTNNNSISSISDYDLYTSTIGQHPVNHIFQAKDGVLFASTQKNGVWSYRDRDGKWQWNAEQ
jgi:hypothetical protein